MKIKIVAVKFFDWVMLAALGVLLAFSLGKSFLIHDRTLTDLHGDIKKYETDVMRRINSDDVQEEPSTDFLGELRSRFEHMAVISPFRRDPFVLPVDIELPMLQVVMGSTKDILIKEARVTDLLAESPLAKVVLDYNPDDGDTVIQIAGLHEGNTPLRFRDDTERTYRLQLNVLPDETLPPPYGPTDVVFAVRPPIRKGTMLREPPMVLTVFFPYNPPLSDPDRGPTTGAWIERKLADDPDVEYVRLNRIPLRQIMKREDASDMWRQFQPEEPAATADAAGGGATAAGGSVIPEAAPDVIVPRASGLGSVQDASLIVTGSFAFLDATVDEGESYLYRIITINDAEGLKSAECPEPFVSPAPINVPSLVQFTVKSAYPDGSAVFDITAPAPDDGMLHTKSFTVKPGMPIGARSTVILGPGAGGAPIGRGVANTTRKDVDFSTGCILVGTLPAYKEIEYRTSSPGGVIKYSVRPMAGSQVLYLTPGGVLRWKGKEEPAAGYQGGPAGRTPGMGMPGGMPGMGMPGGRPY